MKVLWIPFMKHPTDPEGELRRAVRERRAAIVVGTGVSIAASRDPATGKSHPQASWAGLLENGLEWLEGHGLITPSKAAAHRALLKEDADTHQRSVLRCLDDIQNRVVHVRDRIG